jgi:hypothetical protein
MHKRDCIGIQATLQVDHRGDLACLYSCLGREKITHRGDSPVLVQRIVAGQEHCCRAFGGGSLLAVPESAYTSHGMSVFSTENQHGAATLRSGAEQYTHLCVHTDTPT